MINVSEENYLVNMSAFDILKIIICVLKISTFSRIRQLYIYYYYY